MPGAKETHSTVEMPPRKRAQEARPRLQATAEYFPGPEEMTQVLKLTLPNADYATGASLMSSESGHKCKMSFEASHDLDCKRTFSSPNLNPWPGHSESRELQAGCGGKCRSPCSVAREHNCLGHLIGL
ncbi:UNVERIFIED_CONTAM: hypothetical protein K2H54_056632 [Gekko kuhli]